VDDSIGPVLSYRHPAKEWVGALPIGNGRLGAMVFGGVPAERLQLNEDTFWSGGPYDPVHDDALRFLPLVGSSSARAATRRPRTADEKDGSPAPPVYQPSATAPS
jgi:hypothetical protein